MTAISMSLRAPLFTRPSCAVVTSWPLCAFRSLAHAHLRPGLPSPLIAGRKHATTFSSRFHTSSLAFAPTTHDLQHSSLSSASRPGSVSAPSSTSPSSLPASGVTSYVVTTAGPDRPGIVHSIASHLLSLGANIEESRMTCLGSDFAVILRITTPPSVTLEALTASLQSLLPSFLIAARRTSAAAPSAFPSPVHILNISIDGPDQPGVVRAFTSSLSPASGCSVRDLDTDTSSAPFAGYKVFSLRCVVAVPMGGSGREEVMRGLKDFEEKWGFDVIIDEEEAEGADTAEGEAADDVAEAEVETDDVADSRHKDGVRGRRQ